MRFCCIVSHFMYHGLVTTFDIHCILFIYDDACSFLQLCLTCVVFFFFFFLSLFMHMFLVYNLFMFHT